ncbi:MAG: hypothetical protein IIT42_04675 [Clostridia bacterium]|nr:hypothetical protein [Clostridia bacterium]
MDIKEKVAYIRGLTDGLKLDENNDTVKVLKAVIDLLDDISEELTDLGELYDDLTLQVDEIDQDLSIVEDDLYDDDEDDDFDDFDEDGEYYEVVCPNCGDEICVSEDILIEGGIDCPNCGKMLEFDFSSLSADDINSEEE